MEGSSTHLRCSVQIDLCALERNLGKLRHFIGVDKKCFALVSADAFGYGVNAAVARLMLGGADAFAVTNLAEGIRVREEGEGWPVIVMNPTLPGEEEYYFENSLVPTIASSEEADRFEKVANKTGKKIRVHVRAPVDGDALPSPEEGVEIARKILSSKLLELGGICVPGTGTGAPVEGGVCDKTFAEFAEKNLSGVPVHHSDICDLDSLPKCGEKILRAGLVLFGMRPLESSILSGFKPERVMKFRASVSLIKMLPKGASVGYCRRFVLSRDSKVALISVGYGDGLARDAGNKTEVIVRGRRAKVIGVVSMDQAAIDVTDIDGVSLGDEVLIIGSDGKDEISIEEFCAPLGITPAQALTSITKRVARFYKTLY